MAYEGCKTTFSVEKILKIPLSCCELCLILRHQGISYSEIWRFFKQVSPNFPNEEIRAVIKGFQGLGH